MYRCHLSCKLLVPLLLLLLHQFLLNLEMKTIKFFWTHSSHQFIILRVQMLLLLHLLLMLQLLLIIWEIRAWRSNWWMRYIHRLNIMLPWYFFFKSVLDFHVVYFLEYLRRRLICGCLVETWIFLTGCWDFLVVEKHELG